MKTKIGFMALLVVPLPSAGATAQQSYFPSAFQRKSVLCEHGLARSWQPVVSAFEAAWYARHLRAANEPSLYSLARRRLLSSDSLRFIWLRTFDPPVIVRVDRLSSSPILTATELSGMGGYEPGAVRRRTVRSLSTAEASTLRRLLAVALGPKVAAKECASGTDGSEWLFERVRASSYRFVNRWTPEKGDQRRLGLLMLKLTGWRFREVY